MPTHNGGCLCGRIRFSARGTPRFPHTCSCHMCQRHSGSLTLCWVEFDKADVSWTGEGGAPSLYRSSEGSSRAFCPTCGSSLGAIDDAPTVALLLGCFDAKGADAFRPTAHSFSTSRPRWWTPGVRTDTL
ncbi:GFA family protein [Pseudomonas oryziphila]|uniref:GFA family protein n=2 Tax=Pseudomonas TaxID=286 RepID=A0ABN5TJB2_9PSED|nr:GFA family protein [Pseudomonas oryziphila]AZL69172.1 GFA family protein [Pseudomonas oryziphila]AZL74402.1 GFA family protein [Pseudomonas oryziphila]